MLANLKQAQQRVANEKKKQNEKKRKAENHHKYIMGGIIQRPPQESMQVKLAPRRAHIPPLVVYLCAPRKRGEYVTGKHTLFHSQAEQRAVGC